MALYKALKAVNDRIGAMLGIINTIFLLMITVIIFAQVILRYVLKAPLSWSEEFATYIFSIETFLGAAMVLRSDKHVRVTALLNTIKNKRMRTAIDVICDIVILVLCLMLCIEGGQVIARLMKISQVSPSMPWLKVAYVNVFIPVSMGLMVLIKMEAVLGKILNIGEHYVEKGEVE